jgi:coronin-1B/1C/6
MTSRQNSLASPAATAGAGAEPPSALRRSPSYSSYTSATFGGGRSPSTDSFAPPPTGTYSASASAPGAAPGGGGGGALEAEVAKLKDENAKLVEELRGEREKVRNLELALESAKANARRAAEALLGQ